MVKPVKRAELLRRSTKRVPARTPPVEPPVAHASPMLEDAHTLRILLAEDSQDNVLLIQSYLKASGCRATVAVNARTVQKVIAGTYDVVLMDVQMPVMDGYAATRKIRQWEAKDRRPADTHPGPDRARAAEEVLKSLDAGCTAHLTKPIRKATLCRRSPEHASVHVRVDASLRRPGSGLSDEAAETDVATIDAARDQADYDNRPGPPATT